MYTCIIIHIGGLLRQTHAQRRRLYTIIHTDVHMYMYKIDIRHVHVHIVYSAREVQHIHCTCIYSPIFQPSYPWGSGQTSFWRFRHSFPPHSTWEQTGTMAQWAGPVPSACELTVSLPAQRTQTQFSNTLYINTYSTCCSSHTYMYIHVHTVNSSAYTYMYTSHHQMT